MGPSPALTPARDSARASLLTLGYQGWCARGVITAAGSLLFGHWEGTVQDSHPLQLQSPAACHQ